MASDSPTVRHLLCQVICPVMLTEYLQAVEYDMHDKDPEFVFKH